MPTSTHSPKIDFHGPDKAGELLTDAIDFCGVEGVRGSLRGCGGGQVRMVNGESLDTQEGWKIVVIKRE